MKLGNSFTRVLSRFYQFPEPFLDRGKVKLFSYFISTPFDYLLTLGRTHKVIPPPWYRGGGGGGGGLISGTPPLSFWYVKVHQYFEKALLSSKRLWSSQQDKLYFMGSVAASDLWRHQTWSPPWPPSWILPRIRNQVKTERTGNFLCLTCKITHK